MTGPLNFGNTDRLMDGLRTANENFGPSPFVGNMLPIPEEGEQLQPRDMFPELKNPFADGKEFLERAQEGVKDIAEGKNPFTSGREPDAEPSVFDRIKARGSEYFDNSKDRFDKLINGENPFAQKDAPDNPSVPKGADMEQDNPFEKAVGEHDASGLATDGPAPEQKPAFEKMEIGDTAKEAEQEMGQ